MSCGLALHPRSSLPGSLEQGLDFGRPADYLWRRHLVGRQRQSRRPPRNPQCAVQPAMIASAAWMPDSLIRPPRVGGLRRFKPSLRRAWPGSMPPLSESGERGPGKVPGRPGERSSAVALVSCFKSSCEVDCGVRRRGLADGLRGIGVIVEVEVGVWHKHREGLSPADTCFLRSSLLCFGLGPHFRSPARLFHSFLSFL